MGTTEYSAEPASAPRVAPLGGTARGGLVARARAVPIELWLLGGIVLLAAVLRFVTIATQSLWTDEALTAYETHLSFGGMLSVVTHVETTPPLYFVLIWGWAKLFGTGETALRFISALSGVALVPLAYASARELFSRRAGLVAAALAAVNPFLIWYSQEARSYALLATFSAASFLWFARSLRDPSRRNLALWVVSGALALMTHFFAGFIVAPEALWLLWRTRAARAPVLVGCGVLAAVQGAMLPFALADTSHGTGWIHAIPLQNRMAQVPLQFAVSAMYRRATQLDGFAGGAALLVLVLVLIAWRADARARRGAAVAGSVAAAVVLVPLLLGRAGPDYFLARNVIGAWVPLAVLVAAACVRPGIGALAGAALAAVLVALFAYGEYRIETTKYLQKPDWRAVATAIGPARTPTALLVAGGATADPLKIYLGGVPWVPRRGRTVVVDQVVVVGTLTRTPLAPEPVIASRGDAAKAGTSVPAGIGSSIPRLSTPPGTVKVSRVRVYGWVVARFRTRRPWRVRIDPAGALVDAHGPLARRFFHRLPAWILQTVQQPAH